MTRVFSRLILLIVVAGCARSYVSADESLPGFFSAIFHAGLIPLELICWLFDSDYWIYAYPNTGLGYTLGYLVGLCVLLPVSLPLMPFLIPVLAFGALLRCLFWAAMYFFGGR